VLLFLSLGVLLGIRHALEADHLAAVVALSTRTRNRVEAVIRGAAWGVGHSTSLLVVGGVCLALGSTLSPAHARWLERGVGVMLIMLGLGVVRRVRRGRLHVHVHRHDGGVAHVHAHRHSPAEDHASSPHQHQHLGRSHVRALIVGTVHGLAGSAALVVLASASAGSFWRGIGYIAAFGFGSIVGMAALSVVIAVPLEFSARRIARFYGAVEIPIAVATMALGVWMLR
jgi:sulfite exporter TauE/SafE